MTPRIARNTSIIELFVHGH